MGGSATHAGAVWPAAAGERWGMVEALSRRAPGAARVSGETLVVGGLTPLTTIDFPGRLAAVVFCQGCPWRCRYCQNGHLLPPSAAQPVAWTDVLALLERRRGLLDGVVFSGGEPTRQAALPEALRQVRALGFAAGLHTAGPYPGRLAEVLPLLEWVGLDVKAPREDYARVTGGGPASGARAWQSLRLVIESGVAYEVRTTLHPGVLSSGALLQLARELAAEGVERYVLQECVTGHCLDPTLAAALPGRLGDELAATAAGLFPRFDVRRV